MNYLNRTRFFHLELNFRIMKLYAKLGGKQMTFKGFSKKDFKTMQIPGLEARMNGIQTDIQQNSELLGKN